MKRLPLYISVIALAIAASCKKDEAPAQENGLDEDDAVDVTLLVHYPSALDSLSAANTINGFDYPLYKAGIPRLGQFGVYPKDIDPMTVHGYDWMDGLQDCTLVKHLSIPGSHDATTYGVSAIAATWSQDQVIDLKDQFDYGTRYFDVRCVAQKDGGKWRIHTKHDIIDCNVTLLEVVKQLAECLKNHPSEGVLLNLSARGDYTPDAKEPEDRETWKTAFLSEINLIKGLKNLPKYVELRDEMTLGELRGAICVLWDDNQFDEAKDYFCSHSTKFGTSTSDRRIINPGAFDSKIGEANYCTLCYDGSILRHVSQNDYADLLSYVIPNPRGKSAYVYAEGRLHTKIWTTAELWDSRYMNPSTMNNVWHVHFMSGCNRCDIHLCTSKIAHLLNYVGMIDVEAEKKYYVSMRSPLYLSTTLFQPLGIIPLDFIGAEKYEGKEVWGKIAPKVIYMHNFFGGNDSLYASYVN